MVNETTKNLVGDNQTPGNLFKISKKRSFSEATKLQGATHSQPTGSPRTSGLRNRATAGGSQRLSTQSHRAELKQLIKIVPKLSKEDLSKVVGSILKRRKRDPQTTKGSRTSTAVDQHAVKHTTIPHTTSLSEPPITPAEVDSRRRALELPRNRLTPLDDDELKVNTEPLDTSSLLDNRDDLAQMLLDQAIRYLQLRYLKTKNIAITNYYRWALIFWPFSFTLVYSGL